MVEKVIYTKEEIETYVKVPAIVEVELKHLIEERMKQSGLYYRLFSRIKAADSLARKYQIKSYHEEKKIQDLIGVRIDVYFEDDLRICKKMMEQLFELVGWSESEQNDIEFKPMKINGVFRLPDYLKKQISNETWNMCIDDTVEIQLKTVFFEGWHEIEHDMKYKGGELWSEKTGFSRYFNSILATLELCDKSLVTLFENLGHDLYKEGNWAGMMKAHYRLKMEERSLYPEVEQLLNNDKSENNIGKILFKTNRQILVDELLKQPRRVPINVNTIIALINQAVIHNEHLDQIFHDRDVFDDGNDQLGEEMTFRKLEPLRKVNVFNAHVNLSTFKYSKQEACEEAAKLAYSWMYDKFGHIDTQMPKRVASFSHNLLGFRISMDYDPINSRWRMECMHIDMEAPGQVWVTEANCYLSADGRQMLDVSNAYAVSEERRLYLNRYFSCPKFYSNIADRIGVFDVRYLSTSRRIIKEHQIRKIYQLIMSPQRTMPVCLVISDLADNGWLDENWLDQFRVYDFTRMAGRYTHIYTCNSEVGRQLLANLHMDYQEPTLIVFKALKGKMISESELPDYTIRYHQEEVYNCSYGRHQMKQEGRRYDIVKGGQAFYHKLLQEIRSEIIDI